MKLTGGRPEPACGMPGLALAYGVAVAVVAAVVAVALGVSR